MWNDPTLVLPADGATVWIRRVLYDSQTAVPAVYVSSSQTFTCPNSLSLGWVFVSRWKLR